MREKLSKAEDFLADLSASLSDMADKDLCRFSLMIQNTYTDILREHFRRGWSYDWWSKICARFIDL